MSYQVSDSLYVNDIEQIRKDSEFLNAQYRVQRIAIFSPSGRYLFDSVQEKVPAGFIDSGLLELASNTEGALNRWLAMHIEVVGAIRFDGQLMGGLYFELDVSEELAGARQSLLELFLIGLALIVLATSLGLAIARSVGTARSLKLIESNYDELIEQSPLPYAIYSVDGQRTYHNPAFRK